MVLGLILVAQVIVVVIVSFVLLGVLRRELFEAALQELEHGAARDDIAGVSVVSASALSSDEDRRLKAALRRKFPAAQVDIGVNAELRGGIVVLAGDVLLDHSVLTRIKHLFGKADA